MDIPRGEQAHAAADVPGAYCKTVRPPRAPFAPFLSSRIGVTLSLFGDRGIIRPRPQVDLEPFSYQRGRNA